MTQKEEHLQYEYGRLIQKIEYLIDKYLLKRNIPLKEVKELLETDEEGEE